MRVYVATGTPNHPAARKLKQDLRDCGVEITHDWTGTDHMFSPNLDHDGDADAKKTCALNDKRGVRTADHIVYLSHESCFGANIELGMALAYGVSVIVVDPVRGSVFFELDEVTIMTDAEMRKFFGVTS